MFGSCDLASCERPGVAALNITSCSFGARKYIVLGDLWLVQSIGTVVQNDMCRNVR